MADYTDRYTEKELKALSNKIEQTYKEAYKEISGTINDYFGKFQARDAEMKARLDAGEIEAAYYKQWRVNQIGRGERYEAMRDQIAQRMTHANETAIRYVNDASVNVYTTARNYAAYTIESTGANINFSLMNENAVRAAMESGAKTMPYYDETFPMAKVRLLTNKDIAYGQEQITKSVTSALIQGKDIKSIADDLQKRITTMDRTSALRSARTALGAAQNAGHQAAYKSAADKGIKGQKKWDAVIDDRTRDSHAELDGVTVDVDDEFPNGLMFPKDPDGEPAEVYNCRCRIVYVLDHKDKDEDNAEKESFDEWQERKQAEEQEKQQEENSAFQFTPAESVNEAKSRVKDALGIDDVQITGNLQLANGYLEGTERFVADFPQIKGYYLNMDSKAGGNTLGVNKIVGEMTGGGNVRVKTTLSYRGTRDYSKIAQIYENEAKTKHSYENVAPMSTAAHELTHGINRVIQMTELGLTETDGYINMTMRQWYEYTSHDNANEIIKEAKIAIFGAEHGKEVFEGIDYLGAYALTNNEEMLSEAIAYHYTNPAKPNPFSEKCFELLQAKVKEVLG